ncbi:MAG: acyl-CoA thioesterase [Roseivivax sp.]|nr:acyl-CoA thioesterase [Roseivivax sp.]
MARRPPGTRAEYRAFVPLQTRWADNDAYGHMNNATYFSLFDTAVSYWQIGAGLALTGPGAFRVVIAESGCTYHAELCFPQPLTAGLRVGHLGNSAYRIEVGLFAGNNQTAGAEGFFVQVHVDDQHRPAPLPDGPRAALAALLVQGPAA